jgi:mevalonate kinase
VYIRFTGGLVQYVRTTSKFESLPSLGRELRMLLTNTKVPRSTKALVAGVRQLYDAYPAVMRPLIDAIGGISSSFLEILQHGNSGMSDAEFLQQMVRSSIYLSTGMLYYD